GTVAVQFL
nr:Chain A, Xanthoxycyclin D [Melicope xanthoxyloides]